MRKAGVFLNNRMAGYLIENDRNDYVFRYVDEYFMDRAMPAISLTMPKENQEFRSSSLFPFFYNMLSEGLNRKVQARQFQLDENDAFGLLLKTAGEDTIGAVTVREVRE